MDLAAALTAPKGDRRPWIIGRLISVDAANNRLNVSIDGSESVALPFIPGTYTGVTTVYVLRDPYGTGAGDMVMGPCYTEVAPPPPPPVAPPATESKPVVDTALIRPTWSGTYRNGGPVIGYNQWNVNRYGGRSTLYQGNAFGSGPLTGLAVYGTQVADLGALSISRIVVSTPLVTGSGSITLQGSASGTKPAGAPTTTGGTAAGVTAVELTPAMCEAFRTGSVKGLAAVGSAYRGTYGTSYPKGMALTVVYSRPA